MNYINKPEKLKEIKLDNNNYFVVADFDRTITAGDSESTWGSISKAGVLPEEYAKKRQELHNKYRPIEIDTTIEDNIKSKYMNEWFKTHINLFYEYGITEQAINTVVEKNLLKFREGAKEYIEYLHKNNIPLIIVSAGIGNIIKGFLEKNNCYFSNIVIISNFIEFENGKMKTIKNETIHSLNKNIVKLPKNIQNKLGTRKYTILYGDGLADIKMVPKENLNNTISVGFLEAKILESLEAFNNVFDIVCTYRTSFEEARQTILEYTKK